MPTDTTVNNLIINKLSKSQYDSIQNKSETELYLVPDEIDSTPAYNSTNLITSGGVYGALTQKAALASPALTGTPTAPTAAAGTNTTQIATTAFVQSAIPTDVSDFHSGFISSEGTSFLRSHPESDKKVLLPYLYNDLAFLIERGGTISVYSTTSTTLTPLTLTVKTQWGSGSTYNAMFDACANYYNFGNTSAAEMYTDGIIIDITFPEKLTYENTFYIDFGGTNFGFSKIDLLQLLNGGSEYTSVASGEDVKDSQVYYKYFTASSTGAVGIRIHLYNKVSNTAGARIAQIGVINYSSKGMRMGYMSRGIDDPVYRNVSPNTDNQYTLGVSNKAWKTVFAYKISKPGGSATELFTTSGSVTGLKTINNESLFGSGNITISGGGGNSNVEIIELEDVFPSNDNTTSLPSGTYANCVTALTAGKEVILRSVDTSYSIIEDWYCNGYDPTSDEIYFTDGTTKTFSVTNDDSIDKSDRLNYYELKSNKVTSISSSSTDIQYPSAKLLYDQLALKASLASPAFTGTPTSTTPSANDNSTKIATTAFVQSSLSTVVKVDGDGYAYRNGTPGIIGFIDDTNGACHALPGCSTGDEDDVLATTDQIPTESTVSGWGFTKNTGTYSKPSGGIPASDLTSAVQTSLGKADTALQSYTETDPVFLASAAHGISSTDISNWNAKQKAITVSSSEPTSSDGSNGDIWIVV